MRQQANTGQFQQQFHGRSRVAQPVETKQQEWKRFLTRDEQKRYEELDDGRSDRGMRTVLTLAALAAGALVGGPGVAVVAAMVMEVGIANISATDAVDERAELRTEASLRALLHRPTR